MHTTLKRTGLFLGLIFLAGYIVNIFSHHSQGVPLLESFVDGYQLIVLAMAALFTASAFIKPIQWVQPVLFLAMTPLSLSGSHESFYGLGAFVIGVLLFFRLGFYARYRAVKLIASLAYLFGWEIFFALRTKRELAYAFTPIFFIAAFILILYFAYQEKIMVYLKEPKEKLSLAKRGLSAAERTYVLALVGGMGPKEIAAEYEVSDSTVRNTIARSYQKLGVHDRSGLAALSEKYEFVE